MSKKSQSSFNATSLIILSIFLSMLGGGIYNYKKNVDPNGGASKVFGISGMALQGAGMGAIFGPAGVPIGGIVGGLYGAYSEFTKPYEQNRYEAGPQSTGEYELR